jgi:glycosyltransferase involved in cell wall biosynthesis
VQFHDFTLRKVQSERLLGYAFPQGMSSDRMRESAGIKYKLAIVATHPIQYCAPVFQALACSDSLEIRVFYTWSQTASGRRADIGFGRTVKWDIPLLDGYAYEFVPNIAKRPGADHFWGLRNPTLIHSVEEWRPDALLVYGWNSWTHLKVLRHFKRKVPILFRGDSTLLDRQPPLRAMSRRAALRWVYRHVDVALAVGKNNRDYFTWCGLPSERIVFAPHSVDTERFSRNDAGYEERALAWRRELGIEDSAVVIVFAGKLQSKKDPRLLLDGFMQADIAAHLVFVGEGKLENRLRAAAKGRQRIHFMPFQNQTLMPAVYRLGDLFVLPSCGPGETWGLALNEAMASGRAIVASTKVGGARDLINHSVNGWIFESRSLPGLIGVLREAANLGREGLRLMGEQGCSAIAHWSTEESAGRIGAAVLNLIRDWKSQGE